MIDSPARDDIAATNVPGVTVCFCRAVVNSFRPLQSWQEPARSLMKALAAILTLALAALAAALWVYRDIPAATLEARYAGPGSKFINIDGARIHFRDEGTGPAIVLVHADFASLIDWDPWVETLKDRYRVVRFDLAGHGLTGPDPTGDYSEARTLALLGKLVDALGLRQFTLGGTAFGARLAVHYAATHPERVQRLILLDPGPVHEAQPEQAGEVPRAAWLLQYILPRALVVRVLESGFGDPARLTDAQVDRWHELSLREGQREAILRRLAQQRPDDLEGALRGIHAPVLLLWGEADAGVAGGQPREFLGLLPEAADTRLIVYPGVGRLALEEAGPETGRDVRAWLDAGAKPAGGTITRPSPRP